VENVLLLLDNTKTAHWLSNKETAMKLCWTMLPHSPFSPDLILSDLYHFGLLKNVIYGAKFGDDKVTVEM
jgi:hypothetical protein